MMAVALVKMIAIEERRRGEASTISSSDFSVPKGVGSPVLAIEGVHFVRGDEKLSSKRLLLDQSHDVFVRRGWIDEDAVDANDSLALLKPRSLGEGVGIHASDEVSLVPIRVEVEAILVAWALLGQDAEARPRQNLRRLCQAEIPGR